MVQNKMSFFDLFTTSYLKYIIIFILVLIIPILTFYISFKINRLTKDNEILKVKNQILVENIEQQNESIRLLKTNVERIYDINKHIHVYRQELLQKYEETERKLNREHENNTNSSLGNIAIKKPDLVESVINKSVAEIIKEIEDLTNDKTNK